MSVCFRERDGRIALCCPGQVVSFVPTVSISQYQLNNIDEKRRNIGYNCIIRSSECSTNNHKLRRVWHTMVKISIGPLFAIQHSHSHTYKNLRLWLPQPRTDNWLSQFGCFGAFLAWSPPRRYEAGCGFLLVCFLTPSGRSTERCHQKLRWPRAAVILGVLSYRFQLNCYHHRSISFIARVTEKAIR